MKGKTILNAGVFLVFIFYWINLGAFVITDIAFDFPGLGSPTSSIKLGETLTWADAALWQNANPLAFVFIILFLAIGASLLSRSFDKKYKLWKKILIIVTDLIMLLVALGQLITLFSVSGKVIYYMPGPIYMFTIGTTGTVYILYLVMSLLTVGSILMVVDAFKLPNQKNTSPSEN